MRSRSAEKGNPGMQGKTAGAGSIGAAVLPRRRQPGHLQLSLLLGALTYVLAAAYLFVCLMDLTRYKLPWPAVMTRQGLRWLMLVLIVLRFFLTDSFRKFRMEWIAGSFILVVLSLAAHSNQYDFLVDAAVLMLGMTGLSAKKLVTIYCAEALLVRLTALFGTFSNVIDDVIFVDLSGQVRHGFGSEYATDFAAALFFLLLFAWLAVDQLSDVWIAAAMLAVAVLVYRFCRAKTTTLMLGLAAAAVLGYALWRFAAERRPARKARRAREARLEKQAPEESDQVERAAGDGGKRSGASADSVDNRPAGCGSVESSAHDQRSGAAGILCAIVGHFLAWMFPICSGIMITLSVAYDPSKRFYSELFAKPALVTLAERFRLAHAAFERYGFHLFGTHFDMYGVGTPGEVYNFVDSSGCMILVRYGIAALLIFTILNIFMAERARRSGNIKLLLVMALVSIQCAIEHHYTEAAYNVLLLLPFANLDFEPDELPALARAEKTAYAGGRRVSGGQDSGRQVSSGQVSGRQVSSGQVSGRQVSGGLVHADKPSHKVFWSLYSLAVIAAAVLIVPKILPWSRTLTTVLYYGDIDRRSIFAVGSLLGIAAAAALFLEIPGAILSARAARAEKAGREQEGKSLKSDSEVSVRRKIRLAVVACAALVIAGECTFTGMQLKNRRGQFEDSLQKGSTVMNTLAAAKSSGDDFRLFIDTMPVYYKERYGSLISENVLSRNGLAEAQNTVLIENRYYDLAQLILKGWVFAQISDWECIYTNSPAAITALENAGIAFTHCYSVRTEIDPAAMTVREGGGSSGICLLSAPYYVQYGFLNAVFSFHREPAAADSSALQNPSGVENAAVLPDNGGKPAKSGEEANGSGDSEAQGSQVLAVVRMDSDFRNVHVAKELLPEDFDENGDAKVEITQEIEDATDVTFSVEGLDGSTDVKLTGLSFGKVDSPA